MPTDLVEDDPVGVNLRIALWIQNHSLVGSEVSERHLCVFGADINVIDHLVLVKVALADIPDAVSCGERTESPSS